MTNQKMLGWAVLMAACCVGTACIPYEEAREEFCQNADPARQKEICSAGTGEDGGRTDGGTGDGGTGDGGTTPDAGTQPACTLASECPVPTNSCLNAATCIDGQCRYSPREGDACNDGNACTLEDKCNSSGLCVGTPKLCNAPTNDCVQPSGVCINGDCAYSFKSAGETCDDGNPCTLQDSCNGAGACGGTPKVCNSPPNTQCYEAGGTCNSANGNCTYSPKPINTACNDGDACTYNDVCNGAGACGGAAIVCNTPSVCQEQGGTCVNGDCRYPSKPVNTACSDNDVCTSGDRCDGAGSCTPTDVILQCPGGFCQISGQCDPRTGCDCPDGCAAGACI